MGLGAHSYMADDGHSDSRSAGGLRYSNTEDMSAYSGSIERGALPIEGASVKRDTEKDAMGIYVFTALRTREGVDLKDFEGRFGKTFESAFSIDKTIDRWRDAGYIEKDDRHFKLTEAGIDRSNDIMSEFV